MTKSPVRKLQNTANDLWGYSLIQGLDGTLRNALRYSHHEIEAVIRAILQAEKIGQVRDSEDMALLRD